MERYGFSIRIRYYFILARLFIYARKALVNKRLMIHFILSLSTTPHTPPLLWKKEASSCHCRKSNKTLLSLLSSWWLPSGWKIHSEKKRKICTVTVCFAVIMALVWGVLVIACAWSFAVTQKTKLFSGNDDRITISWRWSSLCQ